MQMTEAKPGDFITPDPPQKKNINKEIKKWRKIKKRKSGILYRYSSRLRNHTYDHPGHTSKRFHDNQETVTEFCKTS